MTDSSGAVVGRSNGEYITDENGRIVINDLTPGVTVTAREVKTLEGYVLDTTPKSILIKAGEVQTLRFYNSPQGTLVIRKLDSVTKEPLAGVEFELTYAEGGYVDDANGHLSSKGLYSLTSGTGYSTELPTAVNAGDYTVYYKVVGSSDYADVAENSLTVTIGKKEVTATPKDVTITRGSAIPAFELIYTGLLGEDTLTPSTDPTFTCFEADGTTSVSTRTAAGTYTITWTNTDIFDDETNYRVVAAPGTLTINNPSYSGGSSTPSYSVTVPKTENGTITVSPKSASRGGTVTITVTPDDGYTLETLTATDAKGNKITLTDKGSGKYTFQMPDSKVTVEATFVPVETEPQPCDGGVTCPAYHFTDVDTSAWYHEAVDYVLLNGLMSGYGGGLFGPNDSLSRAQLAQILYNREGQPTTGSGGVFTDVAGDAWYSDAVTWANLSGIVEGYGNGRFGPNDPITREQLAVMLYRYAQLKGKGFTGMWAFRLDYADAASVSDYAYEAMCWCTMNGVISGYEDKTLRPQNNATRAQVAQMLKNFLENIGK